MKKLFVLTASAFCFISAGKAQNNNVIVTNDFAMQSRTEALISKDIKEQLAEKRKLELKEVSDRTMTQFYADFGALPIVETGTIPGFDKVTFLKDGKEKTAYYDNNYDLVGTIEVRLFEDLPGDAQDYINRRFNDFTVKAVRFYDDNEANDTNMYLYDQQFADEDSYFVELEKDSKTVLLHVTLNGTVYYFSQLR